QQITLVSGLTACRRRTSSGPDSPSVPNPATTNSGRRRAEASTAFRPSLTASISSAAPDLISTYWSRERPSGVSHTTTFVGIVLLVSADAGKGLRLGDSWVRAEGLGPGGLLDQPAPDRDRHGLGSVVRPELLEDPLEVRLHRVGRDPEIVRDLLGRGAVGHLLQDLLLTPGERRRLHAFLGDLRLFDERAGELRVDHGLALQGEAGRVHELVRGGVLQHV